MVVLRSKQQELFAQLVAKGETKSGAYREAYPRSKKWSDKSVWESASRLAANPKVSARIDELVAMASEKAVVDAAYVLRRLVEIDQMDVLDIMKDDGALKPIQEWPRIWRQFVAGMDFTELVEGRGDEKIVIGVLKKIKWPDKLKNLELLGKHLNVGAFVERRDHTSSDGSMSTKDVSSTAASKLANKLTD